MKNSSFQDSKLVIDWKLGTRLAGNNLEVAKEILALLIKTLPHDLIELKEICRLKKYSELSKRIHKLHGGLCYCGTPRLKNATSTLEIALKQKQFQDVELLLDHLEKEAQLVITSFNEV